MYMSCLFCYSTYVILPFLHFIFSLGKNLLCYYCICMTTYKLRFSQNFDALLVCLDVCHSYLRLKKLLLQNTLAFWLFEILEIVLVLYGMSGFSLSCMQWSQIRKNSQIHLTQKVKGSVFELLVNWYKKVLFC